MTIPLSSGNLDVVRSKPTSAGWMHTVRTAFKTQRTKKDDKACVQLCLKQGYCALPQWHYPRMEPLIAATRHYFAQPQSIKSADRQSEPMPLGYQSSGRYREMFIWQPTVHAPVLHTELQHLWTWSHSIAITYLGKIAAALDANDAAYRALAYPAGAASPPWETTLLRLIQYRSQPSQSNTHTAMTSHTDVGLITIGLRTAPGLQIKAAASEKWQNVESTVLCGQPILLVGETLRLLTGNALPSCVHRVSEIGADRLAWVYQLRMRADARVDFQALAGRQTGPINGALSNMTGAQMLQYLIERSGTHIA